MAIIHRMIVMLFKAFDLLRLAASGNESDAKLFPPTNTNTTTNNNLVFLNRSLIV